MFNPSPQRASQQAWTPDVLLKPATDKDARFATQDWENVPQLDYRNEQFRQLAVPNPARVVEDASGFETWKPKQVGQARFLNEDEALKAEASEPDHVSSDDAPGVSTPAASVDAADEAFVADEPLAPVAADGDATVNEGASEDESSTPAPATHADEPAESAEGIEAASESAQADADTAADPLADTDEATASDASQHAQALEAEPEPAPADTLLDSEAVQQACDTARQEGHEQGLQQGRAEGMEQAQTEAREALEAALLQADVDKNNALQALREELEGELEPLKRQLGKLIEQTQALVSQPDALYEPVKRLSLHLAEQLVLGELNLSSGPIQRLIQRCLDELDLHGNPPLVVELHPQDKARLQDHVSELSQNISLQAVQTLLPGSVRVIVNDTMVEDLVGNRLEALARGLLVQPEAWREQSPFFRQPLAQRDAEVQDAPARVAAAPAASAGLHTTASDAEDAHDDGGELDA